MAGESHECHKDGENNNAADYHPGAMPEEKEEIRKCKFALSFRHSILSGF
jgi:hypothetical protein